MPKTPVKFIQGAGLAMETVDGKLGIRYVMLASIAHMLKVMALGEMRMIGVCTCHHIVSFQVFVGELIQDLLAQLVIVPGQPFERHFLLIVTIAPSTHRFTGKVVGDHAVNTQITVAG